MKKKEEMKMDEYEAALNWLAENTDKWQRVRGNFEFLIPNPEEVVPAYVFAYLKTKEQNRENMRRACQMRKALGLNDDLED